MQKPGLLIVLAAFSSTVWAQDIVSAKSGLIHHLVGEARIGEKPVEFGNARFPVMAVGDVLNVTSGFAEVLLTPGAFLRLDAGASVRLAGNSLEDTRLELLSGTALVEVDELQKTNHITMIVDGAQTNLLKKGLYYFDAETSRVKVFDGKAQISDGALPVEVSKGRTLQFNTLQFNQSKPEKFDTKKSKDNLYAWSQERALRLSYANISTSKDWNGPKVRTSMWAWDPFMNMYTFLPGSGTVVSVFGPRWYNPQTVWLVLSPPTYFPQSQQAGSPGPAPTAAPAGGSYGPSQGTSGAGGGGGGQTVTVTTPSGQTSTRSLGTHSN